MRVLLAIAWLAVGCANGANEEKKQANDGDDEEAAEVTLEWDVYAAEDATFAVYYDIDAGDAELEYKPFATGLTIESADFPKLKLTSEDHPELQDLVGRKFCFTITATVGGTESDQSNADCLEL
jgi:hypothetical protein